MNQKGISQSRFPAGHGVKHRRAYGPKTALEVSGAVVDFNGRQGNVVLLSADVTTALGFVPESVIAAGTTAQYWRGDKSWQTLDKSAVGLANADNTTDLAKPISTATQTALNLKLDSASYTAADVLTKLLTVDGVGSGLDADLLDGNSSAFFLPASSYTAADVLTKLLTVDGAGSGLDADLLDAQSGAFYLARGNHTGTQTWATITGTPTTIAGYGITDAQGLDADLTAIAALATTAFGRGHLTLADAAALRTYAGFDNDVVVGAAEVGAVFTVGNTVGTTTSAQVVLARGGGGSTATITAQAAGPLEIDGVTKVDLKVGTVSIGVVTSTGFEPATDNAFYLGLNNDDSPKAWKGLIMKDQGGTGIYYRLEVFGNTLRLVDLTD